MEEIEAPVMVFGMFHCVELIRTRSNGSRNAKLFRKCRESAYSLVVIRDVGQGQVGLVTLRIDYTYGA